MFRRWVFRRTSGAVLNSMRVSISCFSVCVITAVVLVSGGPQPFAAPGPAQRLRPNPRASRATLDSAHFVVLYDPARVTPADAEQARLLAEKGWERCRVLFGEEPSGKVRLDLSPDFVGATGFAVPPRPGKRETRMIGVRYADLDYLGLTAEYVLTHEIAHIFSGDLGGSALGEGIADWAAGTFSGLPMRPWWGEALRKAGLWIEPEAFFITGDFPATPEVDAVIRTAQYAESALLIRFLVARYGWDRTKRFAAEYGRLRGPLESNEDRLRTPRRRGDSIQESAEARRPPDAAAVRELFHKHLGITWGKLVEEWRSEMLADAAPANEAGRFVLAQQLYGAVRNYEMWVLEQRKQPPAEMRDWIRRTFTEANRALARGDLDAARSAFRRAVGGVQQLRRPVSTAAAGRLLGIPVTSRRRGASNYGVLDSRGNSKGHGRERSA